jgi:hypothetical protein
MTRTLRMTGTLRMTVMKMGVGDDTVQGVQDFQRTRGVGGIAVHGSGGAEWVQGVEALGRFVGLRCGD